MLYAIFTGSCVNVIFTHEPTLVDSSKFEPAASPLSELTSNVVSIYMSLSCRTFSMP